MVRLKIKLLYIVCLLVQIGALLFLPSIRKDYSYNQYTFHKQEKGTYVISSGQLFVNEAIIDIGNNIFEFRGNKYQYVISGYKDYHLNVVTKVLSYSTIDSDGGSKASNVASYFVLAVKVHYSPRFIIIFIFLALIGYFVSSYPHAIITILFGFNNIKIYNKFIKITRCFGILFIVLSIYLEFIYLS